MKIWSVLSDATRGWQMIISGQPGWRDRFTLSGAGLATALCVFAFFAFLAVALASMSIGMPATFGVLAAMVILALVVRITIMQMLTAHTGTLMKKLINLGATTVLNLHEFSQNIQP